MSGLYYATHAQRRHWKRADLVEKHIVALRERGLSYRAIAGAIDWFEGVELTPEMVRYKLRELGEQPMASKRRANSRAAA